MKNDFSQGKIPSLVARLALPMILAELFNVLYNMVDRMFISRIEGMGTQALAGVSVSFPLIVLISAFAQLFGMGGAPLCSIARGEGDPEYAERVIGNAFAMLMLAGAALTAVMLIVKRPLLLLLGASEATIVYADQYMGVYLLGTPFVMISMGLNPFINAQGFTRTGMMAVAAGAVLNVLLDPLFIFVFDMGVRGAALATILSQMVSAAWILRFLTSPRAILRLRRVRIGIERSVARRIVSLGTSNFTMRLTECAVQIVCNVTLRDYGGALGDVYVAVMGVISSVRQVLMMPLNGFVQGFQPVMGFNYGAKRYDRVRECFRFTTLICFCYATLCCAVVMLIPGVLIRIFNGGAEMLTVGIPAVRIYFCGFCFLFMQMAGQQSFVALGKSRQAVFFSLLRKAFIVLPLTILLPRYTGLGVNGVFWAETVSDVVGSSACFITFMLTVYRKQLSPPSDLTSQS